MTYREEAEDLPVYGSYDVVVVGGGCAGFAAALAGARNGAKTLVVERFPFFGGTATASLMACINGFRNQVEPEGLQTTKGIGEELILRLKEIGGIGRPTEGTYPHKPHSDEKGDLSYCYVVDTEKLKYMMLKMMKESGAHILFHTWFSRPIMQTPDHSLPRASDAAVSRESQPRPRVKGIIVENKSGRQAIFGSIIIDASGDGDVAARAGAGFWQTRHDEASRLSDSLMYEVTDFTEQEVAVPGCRYESSLMLWGPSVKSVDATNAEELTQAEIQTRLAVYQDLEKKAVKHPGLGGARVVQTPVLLGIRQTRFIHGLYALTGDDVIRGRRFDDCIALGVNPVIHSFGYRRFLEHQGYDIPYRCLLPRDVDGLIVAGRCMSSDQIAYESWRAMAHILAIGEAAGTASALAVSERCEPKSLGVDRLQKRLIQGGAEIGQGRKA